MGPAGPPGADGRDGVDGSNGVDGPDGSDGSDGEDGRNGEDGDDGDDGRDGRDGDDGRDGEDGEDGEDESTGAAHPSGRLAIADASSPGVRLLDLETGLVTATFTETSPGAGVYSTESGRLIAVVQNATDAAADRVDFIDSGLELAADGSTERRPPVMLPNSLVASDLAAANPVHFVSHNGYVTVHFDGVWNEDPALAVAAGNYVLRESDLLEPDASWLELRTESQHGVSVVSMVTEAGHVIFTAPTGSRDVSTLPSGFTIHDLEDGELIQTLQDEDDFERSCIGLHGEAVVGQRFLFGCHERFDGGILVIEYDDGAGEYASRKIRYPGFDMNADPRAPARTSVMSTHHASPYAVGQFGHFTGGVSHYTGLVRIDPSKSELVDADVLDLGAVYCSYGFEQSEGKLAAALTVDGRLHVARIEDWSGYKTLQFLPDGEGSCPGTMVLGDGVAYVAPAGEGAIHEISLTSLEVLRTFHVGGAPSSLALAGFRHPLEP